MFTGIPLHLNLLVPLARTARDVDRAQRELRRGLGHYVQAHGDEAVRRRGQRQRREERRGRAKVNNMFT